jgi:hypothetical protein
MSKLDEQLAGLATLSPAQLRDTWQRVTGIAPPRISPKLLRRALGYELQAKALGELSRSTQQKLAQIAAEKTRTTAAQAGMRLVREWNGTIHVVMIGEDNVVRWNNREWRSLSEVARAITGTRWSGPAFFGLKRRIAA